MAQTGYVYLACPIDLVAPSEKQPAATLRALLTARNVAFYDPAAAWTLQSPPGPLSHALSGVNSEALAHARCVLAYVNGQSVGVPAELQYAQMLGIPAIVLASDVVADQSHVAHKLATALLTTSWVEAADKAADLVAGKGLAFMVERNSDVADLPLPYRAHPGDAGFDLYVSEDTFIPKGTARNVPTGIRIAPPDGIWYLIIGRSSTLHKRLLHVNASIIDNGFRGDLFAMCFNLGDDQTVMRGERVAQIIPMRLIDCFMRECTKLPASSRGTDGFGSTGA